MAYCTIHNDGAETKMILGMPVKPTKTVSLTQSEYFRLVEQWGDPSGYSNVVVTITEPAGLASDAEVAAIVGATTGLDTTQKGTIVGAINEVHTLASAALVAPATHAHIATTGVTLGTTATTGAIAAECNAHATSINHILEILEAAGIVAAV
jgi:hypothetical protein